MRVIWSITSGGNAAPHLSVHRGPGSRDLVVPSDPVVDRLRWLVPVDLRPEKTSTNRSSKHPYKALSGQTAKPKLVSLTIIVSVREGFMSSWCVSTAL